MNRCAFTILVLVVTAGCTSFSEVGDTKVPLAFKSDFEDGKLDAWEVTDPAAWRIEEKDGNMVLVLFKQSQYRPKVRSPLNINLIKDLVVGDFVLEPKMLSMPKEYTDRDTCLFFGAQDPSHFYYVHIANRSDTNANSISVVDGEPRVSIQGGWAKTEKSNGVYDFNWLDVIWFDCNNINL